jgi:large subunit ribosomal protein L4
MTKVKVYNLEGQVTGEEELQPEIFGVVVNPGLVQQAVETQLANRRTVLAHTKTRGEVRGGGRKPWRQKGTGRARHGSRRSPIWVGGGVTFGPRNNRNFKMKINKKAKQKALFMTLSDKVANDYLFILEDLQLQTFKTKDLRKILDKLPSVKDKLLLAVDPKSQTIFQAGRNLVKVKVLAANSLNVYDVLNHKYIILTKKGLETVKQTFIKK